MALSEAEILAIARRHIPSQSPEGSVVHWDTTPKAAGATVRIGRSERPMPFDGYFVFVDLQPQANWGHPALCLLISTDGSKTEVHDTNLPPHLGDYPDSYRNITLR